MGYGSKWIKDSRRYAAAASADGNTGLPATEANIPRALAMIEARRAGWERRLGQPVHSRALFKNDGVWKSVLSIKFEHALGVPKGGIHPGEAPVDAARREFREETGFDIPADQLTATAEPGVFLFRVGDVATRDAIISAWRAMENTSELFDLAWTPAATVLSKWDKINPNSQLALAAVIALSSIAGRRTRRRRFTRKTRRNRK